MTLLRRVGSVHVCAAFLIGGLVSDPLDEWSGEVNDFVDPQR